MKNLRIVLGISFIAFFAAFGGCKKKSETQPAATDSKQEESVKVDDSVIVELDTSAGKIVLDLNGAKAPVTVKNFVDYVNEGFYDGTVFHRVIDGFMVQGGGMNAELKEKQTRAPIKNEAANGLSNAPMTVAMARTMDPNSASAQFFINLVDNKRLDYQGPQNMGYAVFGKVIQGEDVVKKIGKATTTSKGMYDDVPKETITIKKATVKPAK